MSFLINILSDYGNNSLEQYALEAAIIKNMFAPFHLVHTSNFLTSDVIEPAVFLNLTSSSFSIPTIVIIDTKIKAQLPERYLVCCVNDTYYIAPDNGILSLHLKNETNLIYFVVPLVAGKFVKFIDEVCVPSLHFIHALIQNKQPNWETTTYMVDAHFPNITFSNGLYKMRILYINSNGDTYLNLDKSFFDKHIHSNPFSIRLSISESIHKISFHYSQVGEGEVAAIFHPSGILYLAQHHGNAAKLLGLNKDRTILLKIEE